MTNEKNLCLPADCAVLTEEEMTYTEGGVDYLGILSGAATVVGVVVLASAYVWGINQARTWLRDDDNREGNFFTVVGRAFDAIGDDMSVSASNAVRDVVSTGMIVLLAPVSAILLLIR